jgi:dTDP-4-dehydrorhamnose 3,5-epimerase
LKFSETILKGSYIIEPSMFSDDRGGFSRIFCKREFQEIGHTKEFVQFNHSYNTLKGTLRGMHYQVPPFKEIKLIRCVKGAVADVIIDIRTGSPTFLQHVTVELSEKNKRLIYIPEGFAHGFQTLEDDTELIYFHSEYYTPNADSGFNHADPAFGISWPLPLSRISEKDKNIPHITPQFKGI